jgi:hypothetical protein
MNPRRKYPKAGEEPFNASLKDMKEAWKSPKYKALDEPTSSIRTVYNGIEFRSRFEADVAALMDRLGWKWTYEPKSFLLPNGIHYRPDFYVARRPNRGLWVECRGYTSEKGESQIEGFYELIKESCEDYAVLKSDPMEGCHLYGFNDDDDGPNWELWLSRCKYCGIWDLVGGRNFSSCNYCWYPLCEVHLYQLESGTPNKSALEISGIPFTKWRPTCAG